MARSQSRVTEEKMLNDMFIALEYADNFYQFVETLSKECFEELRSAMNLREQKEQ